jgi:hypothetical protein
MSANDTEPDVRMAEPREVASLLGTLFDLKVEVRADTRKSDLDKGVLAIYGSDDGVARTALHFDPTLSASAGAALTRIPASAADEASRLSRLPDNILENLREVTNVLSRLPRTRWGQLRIQSTTSLPTPLAAPIARALKQPRPLAILAVTVTGYRPGLMTVLAVELAAGEETKGGDAG